MMTDEGENCLSSVSRAIRYKQVLEYTIREHLMRIGRVIKFGPFFDETGLNRYCIPCDRCPLSTVSPYLLTVSPVHAVIQSSRKNKTNQQKTACEIADV